MTWLHIQWQEVGADKGSNYRDILTYKSYDCARFHQSVLVTSVTMAEERAYKIGHGHECYKFVF
jgi:hypothetical protein